MLRRQFISLVGGAASWPIWAHAQRSPVRLGLLASGTAGSIFTTLQVNAINQGLRNVGLIDGRDYLIEARFAAGNYGRFPALARELAETGVSVILPNAKTIAVLYNPANPTNPVFLESIRSLADGFTIKVLSAEFKPGAIDAAISRLTEQGADTLHLLSDAALFDAGDSIAASCLAHRLASFSTYPEFAASGGLLAYGTSRRQLFMRSGYFVKRILEGARPADLPIEQPTRIELAVNVKTARALGIDISPSFLGTADEVIE